MSQLFADLGLVPDLTRAIADQGYTQPTPVQMEAIPVVLDGRDVLAGAQTGTGKTAGFALPLLQRLMENYTHDSARHVRALIVTPTRELAAQVEESVRDYGKYLPLRSTVVFGGVGIAPQIEALKEGVDILVATPGRLLDHAAEGTADLSHVEILVLDEADRMLDMGFIHDVKKILALLPATRQNLLFSATFSDDIRELADTLLDNPVSVEVAPRNAESGLVSQRAHPVDQMRKRALLSRLIKAGDWKQVLVFVRTKHGANRLAHQLARGGITATAIHGNKGQGARTKALADFKEGAIRVLVATDLAARGLDIADLPHVVNYDLPHVAEDYVHRIGRTGRAGVQGEAISLVSTEEMPLLVEIEKLLNRKLESVVVPGFEPGSVPPHAQQHPQQRQREGEQAEAAEGDVAAPVEGLEAVEGQGARRGRRRRGRNRNGQERQMPREGAAQEPVSVHMDGEPQPNQAPGPHQPRQAQQQPRARGNEARQSNEQRRASRAEEHDNRGNRDVRPKHDRNQHRDDDWGNRAPPQRKGRRPVWLKPDGEIDESMDDIGNRLPQQKRAVPLDEEHEINYNIALPEDDVGVDNDSDDTQQPESNEGQLFPSSAGFMDDARVRGKRRRGRNNRARGGNDARGPQHAAHAQHQPRDPQQKRRRHRGQGQPGALGARQGQAPHGQGPRRPPRGDGQPRQGQPGAAGQPGNPKGQQRGRRRNRNRAPQRQS